jgi:hypothetical protein
MTHFLKLCYNVFILENKIDARVFRRTCVNLCYILLEIALVCVNLCQFALICVNLKNIYFSIFRLLAAHQDRFGIISSVKISKKFKNKRFVHN